MAPLRVIQRVKDTLQGKAEWSQKRSGKWPTVRARFLADHPSCAVCGGTRKVEVHHRIPFHLRPDLELDPDNLITLCEGCPSANHHLLYGHLGNYKSFNAQVELDANIWSKKIRTRP